MAKTGDGPEEAELAAYMEAGDGQAPGQEDRRAYLQRRHAEIDREYRDLLLQKEEIEARRNEKLLDAVTAMFRENWKARKFVVVELRRLGEEVDDRFVPKSAT